MIRKHYVQQLDELSDNMIRLGSMVEHALEKATNSLETWDATLACQVIDDDCIIDQARHHLEDQIMVIIATQQPVAADLRLLGSAFAIAGELERIGDYACGIARRVDRIMHTMSPLTTIPEQARMVSLVRRMLNVSLEACLSQDSDLAHALTHDEEQVDILSKLLRRHFLDYGHSHPDHIETVLAMLEIVHFLERVADRATNIGERVIYLATSEIEDLNPRSAIPAPEHPS